MSVHHDRARAALLPRCDLFATEVSDLTYAVCLLLVLLLQYPFPVKDSIMWMADHVDLILVFFDPVSHSSSAQSKRHAGMDVYALRSRSTLCLCWHIAHLLGVSVFTQPRTVSIQAR
jgi:hypothetical protein